MKKSDGNGMAQLNVRLEKALIKKLRDAAARDRRSIAQQVAYYLALAVDAEG